MMTVMECPITSAGVYPNSRSAPAFQDVMIPSSVLLMIASSEDSTMAASSACEGGGRGGDSNDDVTGFASPASFSARHNEWQYSASPPFRSSRSGARRMTGSPGVLEIGWPHKQHLWSTARPSLLRGAATRN